jgi:hypothetical protein
LFDYADGILIYELNGEKYKLVFSDSMYDYESNLSTDQIKLYYNPEKGDRFLTQEEFDKFLIGLI